MRLNLLRKLFLPVLTFAFVAAGQTSTRAQTRNGRSAGAPTGRTRPAGPTTSGAGRVIVVGPERRSRIPADDFPTTRRRPDAGPERRRDRREETERRRREPERLGERDTQRLQKLARYLGTSPERLHQLYVTAHNANPDLRPRDFLTALVVGHELQGTHPNITAQTLLRGLQAGQSIPQTLGSLGLRPAEVRTALNHAKRIIDAFTP